MGNEKSNIKYHFFYTGIFSNWHPSDFIVEGVKFNCGEQYVMYTKALWFSDMVTAEKILKEPSPKKQKQLGREVVGFIPDIWDRNRYAVVKKGLWRKFEQNPDFKKELLKYKGCVFVEASQEDRIWGIGYYEQDALSNIDDWGQNLLGKILTELSNEM